MCKLEADDDPGSVKEKEAGEAQGSGEDRVMLWALAGLAAAGYCVARAIVDFRSKRYIWSAMGFASATAILLRPIQSHAVKIDLPMASSQ